jgi:hypothetical protein
VLSTTTNLSMGVVVQTHNFPQEVRNIAGELTPL